MVSRAGSQTVFEYTCFYRGAEGETGGVNGKNIESPVK